MLCSGSLYYLAFSEAGVSGRLSVSQAVGINKIAFSVIDRAGTGHYSATFSHCVVGFWVCMNPG